MTTAQQVLEECCFDFAKKWLPDLVKERGWDCAAAVELTRWTKILKKKLPNFHPFQALRPGSPSLQDLMVSAAQLRHTAVHRQPTTARRLAQLLDSAIKLADLLQDHIRAARLEQLKSEVDSKIRAMELSKNVLENEALRKLDDIRRQREQLDKMEKNAIETMMRDDLNNRKLAGRLLEESVRNIFSGGNEGDSKEAAVILDAEGENNSDDDEEEGEEEEAEIDASNGPRQFESEVDQIMDGPVSRLAKELLLMRTAETNLI